MELAEVAQLITDTTKGEVMGIVMKQVAQTLINL